MGSEQEDKENFVDSINDAVSEEEEKIGKEREMMEKAKELERIRSERKELKEKEGELKDELRDFVKQNPSGHSSKGYPFWETDEVKVSLDSTIRYEVAPKPFVEKVGANQAVPYMKPKRSKIKKALDVPGALENLTEEELEKISEKKEYKEKVKVNIVDS